MNTFAAVLTLTPSFVAPFVASLALAGDTLTIRDLAPDTSLLVVGMDDFRGTTERLELTAFGKLWNDPAIAEEVKAFRAELEKGLIEAAADAGIDRTAVTWPSSLGLAAMIDIDEELGMPSLQYIFFCDWSKEAESAGKMLDAMLANIEKSQKDAGAQISADEVRGRRVLVSKVVEAADEGAEDGMGEGGDEGDDGMDGGMGLGGMGNPFADFLPKELCVTSDKGRLFATGSIAAMDTLLARVDGDHAKSVGASETFLGATELAGGTGDLYAMFSLEAAQPLLASLPPFMIAEPFIKRLIGDVKAISVGLHARDGVIEQSAGVYVPAGKVGLLGLMDLSTPFTAPPSIVPSDAMSYGRMNVRFDRIVPMLDEVIAGLPADQAEMIKPMLDMYRPAMAAAFGVMGPEVHFWGHETDAANAADPMASATVTAVAMRNDKDAAAAVSDFISIIPMGLQPRDFNGMTILSDEFSPIAVGIGGGYLTVGDVKHVEQALRGVDAKGAAGLGEDASFKASMSSLPSEGVVGAWWWDFGRQMESFAGMMNTMSEELSGVAGAGDAPEMPGLGIGLDDTDGFTKLMNPEVVKRCFGDATMDITSTKTGYSMRYRMLPATATK